MNCVRQERNSFAGSSAEGIESDKNSTIAHCPWDMRITPLNDSVLFVLSVSEMGVAETQAQSPLLRIWTSVKTTFACHARESSCIGLVARSPSRIARRKGDPLPGVSTGLAAAIIATTNATPVVNDAHVFIGSKLSFARGFGKKRSSDGKRSYVLIASGTSGATAAAPARYINPPRLRPRAFRW